MAKYALQMKLDPNSERAMQQAFAAMLKASQKDAGEILREASIAFVQAARNMTPKARKNAKREIVEHRGSDRRKRFGVVIRTQGSGGEWRARVRWFGWGQYRTKAEAKRDPLAAVPNVGAGKNSWWGALRDAGKGLTTEGRKLSANTASGSGYKQQRRIVNALAYIPKIAPQIEGEALRKAAKTIAIKAEKALTKQGFR
jgi:hypothetical protein